MTAWHVLLVAVGSALGGMTRWLVHVAFGRLAGAAFPWGTLAINLSGSLFLGWFLTVLPRRMAAQPAHDLRLLVAVGFTGAYTTFSTFEYETNELLGNRPVAAAAYVAASVFLGLLAVRLGVALGR